MILKAVILASALSGLLASSPDAAEMQKQPSLSVQKNGSQPAVAGDAKYFTGKVTITGHFKGTAPARVSGATVAFEPGARTAWHTHPLGQTLVVTAGQGLAQSEGGRVTLLQVGDVVWIPPNMKHWHGATPETGMVHVAISEALDGKTVHWMEKVTDAQYSARP